MNLFRKPGQIIWTPRMELLIFLVLCIPFYLLAIKFDFLESVFEFTRNHEEYELDETITTFVFISFASGFYTLRKLKDIKRANLEIKETNYRLQEALSEIKELRGIITICSVCRKVKIKDNSWQQLESYISEHTDAQFSHGICKDCRNRLYPEFSGDNN